jgi:hypothetical protein
LADAVAGAEEGTGAVTTVEVLRAAKALLTPETWGKGRSFQPPADGKCCLLMAVSRVVQNGTEHGLATAALYRARNGAGVVCWQDAPERTLADIHALIDRAITRERERERERVE